MVEKIIALCCAQSCKRAISLGPNPARTRKYKPEPDPKTNLAPKKTKVKLLGLKNLAVRPSYFDDIFVHLRQKAGLRPE